MSDLVKRLRDHYGYMPHNSIEADEAADRIEQRERELAEWKAAQSYRYIGIDGKPVLARDLEDRAIKAEAEIAAEKALADRLWRVVKGIALMDEACDTCDAYRKARGL